MNENHPYIGLANICVALTGAVMSIALANIQVVVSIAAGIMGIISAGFAIRYYYHKTDEVIKSKRDVD